MNDKDRYIRRLEQEIAALKAHIIELETALESQDRLRRNAESRLADLRRSNVTESHGGRIAELEKAILAIPGCDQRLCPSYIATAWQTVRAPWGGGRESGGSPRSVDGRRNDPSVPSTAAQPQAAERPANPAAPKRKKAKT